MVHTVLRVIAALLLMLPAFAAADPITLKLSFFSSDRSPAYLSAVKPFVDAINSDEDGLLRIKVYFSGTLSPIQSQQPQLVLDGTADIAFVVPGQNPELFSDDAAIELPGLFRTTREATLVHTRLVAQNSLRGYDKFFTIGAFGTEPETVHSRKSITSLADLGGQKLRLNNKTAADAIARLGAAPKVLALNETTDAIGNGTLDGAARLTTNHYLLGVGAAPLALLMNRKVFDLLPEQAKALIRKYSGEWTAARYVETSAAINRETIARIKADPRRTVTHPTPADEAAAQRVFDAVADEWAAVSTHNRDLLTLIRAEIAKVRSVQ